MKEDIGAAATRILDHQRAEPVLGIEAAEQRLDLDQAEIDGGDAAGEREEVAQAPRVARLLFDEVARA